MAKSDEITMSAGQLQEFMEQMQKSGMEAAILMAKTLAEEQKKPSKAQITSREKAREDWRAVVSAGELTRKQVIANCERTGHRNASGQSRIWHFDNVFPAGGMTLICCYCFEKRQNYVLDDPKTGKAVNKLVSNPKFDEWYARPQAMTDFY